MTLIPDIALRIEYLCVIEVAKTRLQGDESRPPAGQEILCISGTQYWLSSESHRQYVGSGKVETGDPEMQRFAFFHL